MIFNLSSLLVAFALTPARLVLATPNADNHVARLELRGPSPHHEVTLNSRHMKKSRLSFESPAKRARHRKRRTCPVPTSASPDPDSPATASTPEPSPSPTSEDPSPTPVAPPESPAASPPDPTSSQGQDQDPTSSQEQDPAPQDQSSSGTSDSDPNIQAYLNMHNNERANHGASALTWADDLAGVAQSWANGCVFKHSGGQYGENLAAGTNVDPSGAVQLWINEAPQYNPNDPQYSHWTQVVWKATQEVGCAVATCSAESIFGQSSQGTAQFYVCEYRPPGNVIGEFQENVQV